MRAILLSVLLCSFVVAEDWTQFRGKSAGSLDAVLHPEEWSSDKNVAWAVELAGSGWSSPIVVGDRIFITSAVSEDGSKPKGMMAGVASMRSFRNAKPSKHKYVLSCLSLVDGKEIWQREIGESTPPVIHPSNTYATESPATDGKHVYCFFATTGTLSAWDLDGKELWRRELGTYKAGNGFGTGSSLTLSDDLVFVQFDNDEQSFVAAFETATGNPKWRDDRETTTSWSSPLIWQTGESKQLVACGSDVVTSYNPVDGKVIWRLSGMQSGFSGSPAVDSDRVYFGNSGPMSAGPLVAVPADLKGEVQLDKDFKADEIAWSRTRSGPCMASPVVAKGHVYIPGRGVLNSYSVETGERAYKERVDDMKTVAASLWTDGDRVFILDEAGTTYVIQAGAEFKLLGKNSIDDLFWSTPAIAGKSLLMRGVKKLYCIRE
ncbi:MAG: PQQ-binding-like beta-propeller repeat protein [Planctomycetota bacterium]